MWFQLVCVLALAVAAQGTGGQDNTLCPGASPLLTIGPIARSPFGVFRGAWDVSRRGRRFQSYRGIKYAEPPVGPRRFQPPVPIVSYSVEVDATQDGPACPQPVPPEYPVSEDCLTINVYTPTNNNWKPLPVILFIHAGGFYSMSGRSDMAGPHYLMDRDVVFVTINYRLSVLGWLSTGDAVAPGNNGMKDQVTALQWVQRNIAAFGGDPNLVTIAGCSAGSISVMLHMISPMSKGLFHRAISMSGSPIGREAFPHHQRDLVKKQALRLDCSDHNSTVLLECLKRKTWQELGDWRGFYTGSEPVGFWSPVVEPACGQQQFLALDPLTAIRQGQVHDVPYIISQTKDKNFFEAYDVWRDNKALSTKDREWHRVAPIAYMMPRALEDERCMKDKNIRFNFLLFSEVSTSHLNLLYGESIIGFPTHRLANLMSRHSSHPVWYYEFSYIGNRSHFEDPITIKPQGAAHHDDMIYLLSLSYRFPSIGTQGPDSDIVDRMTALWYNFARYGDPNPCCDTPSLRGLSWPAMTPADRQYLRIGDALTVHRNLNEVRYREWEQLYPLDTAEREAMH